jgi:5-methylcytosine-specific restriction protein A
MTHITLPQIQAAYLTAADVFDGHTKAEVGAHSLNQQHGLNINTARDLINQYRSLVRGTEFKRSLSSMALDHYLASLLKDKGREVAENAIAATWLHIAYYETTAKTRMSKLRSRVEAFQSSLTGPISAAIYDAQLAAAVVRARKDGAAARKLRLANAAKIPKTQIATGRIFIRNPDVIAEVLELAAGICASCQTAAPFPRKSDGTPYLEVHHKLQLANGGDDTVANAIALCPNCHRKQHYG